MTYLSRPHLNRRTDPGTTFTIVFGAVAATVVIVCAIWGFVIPIWRKKHPPQPTRTKWNDSSVLTVRLRRSIRSFPSHPAIKPLLSKSSETQILPTYNPRTESPFPESPQLQGVSSFGTTPIRSVSAPMHFTNLNSDGLFTPVRQGQISREDTSANKCHTVPRALDAKSFTDKLADFGNAKNFTLAIPEPLLLRPRSAGRVPGIVKHRENYCKVYPSSPASSDKLLHPNLLLGKYQNKVQMRSSLCSSTSLQVDHRHSDSGTIREVASVPNQIGQDGVVKSNSLYHNHVDDAMATSYLDNDMNTSSPKAPNISEKLHKPLLTAHAEADMLAATSRKIPRAKLVGKPQFPFVKSLNSREESGTNMNNQMSTSSTLLTLYDRTSEIDSNSTQATSPVLFSDDSKHSVSPLQPYSHPDILNGFDNVTTLAQKELTSNDKKSFIQTSSGQGFYQPGRRSKAKPLSIKTHNIAASPNQHCRHSFSDTGGSITGMVVKETDFRSRVRASSMYSRDTSALDLIATPITLDFPSPMVNIFAEHDVTGNPFHNRESVRSRIQIWKQRIEDNASNSQLPSKSASPLLPVSSNSSLGFPRPLQNGEKSVQKNEVVSSEQGDVPDTGIWNSGTAPGGAIWI